MGGHNLLLLFVIIVWWWRCYAYRDTVPSLRLFCYFLLKKRCIIIEHSKSMFIFLQNSVYVFNTFWIHRRQFVLFIETLFLVYLKHNQIAFFLLLYCVKFSDSLLVGTLLVFNRNQLCCFFILFLPLLRADNCYDKNIFILCFSYSTSFVFYIIFSLLFEFD